MPEDVGGTPFSDGWDPDDDHDHGMSDEEFDTVVFDEAFVKAAVIHEPTAVERLLAAAQARAEASEAEARRAHGGGERYDDGYGPDGPHFGSGGELDGPDDTHVRADRYGATGTYGKHVRWHRPVAWLLALVMGIGMIALAFAAVYRSASSGGNRDQLPRPSSTGLEQGTAAAPSMSADYSPPAQQAVSAVPRTP